MTLPSSYCDFKFSEWLWSKLFQDGYTSDQINKIDQLVTPCFVETGGYALNAKRQKLTRHSCFAIYPSNRLWFAQVDEHIHDIITDLIS